MIRYPSPHLFELFLHGISLFDGVLEVLLEGFDSAEVGRRQLLLHDLVVRLSPQHPLFQVVTGLFSLKSGNGFWMRRGQARGEEEEKTNNFKQTNNDKHPARTGK